MLKIYFKKALISAGLLILFFLLFIFSYLMMAYFLSRISVEKETAKAQEVPIFIKTNGVHTDLVLPVRNEQMDWSQEIKYSNTRILDTNMRYIAMGWGDKGFYLETPNWPDLKFSVAYKAAFGLGNTAIHATYYKRMNENKGCKRILISALQYARLVEYITNSFEKDSAGHLIYIKTGANYGNTDAFYEANGSYSLFQTCNSWANSGLKYCGQKACLWTAFDTGIFSKYEK